MFFYFFELVTQKFYFCLLFRVSKLGNFILIFYLELVTRKF